MWLLLLLMWLWLSEARKCLCQQSPVLIGMGSPRWRRTLHHRGLQKNGAQLQTTWRSAKNAEKPPKNPSHHHSRHTVRILSMNCASRPAQQGHRQRFKCTATAGPSQFSDISTIRHLSLHNDGHVNDSVQLQRAATVGSRLYPHRLHPRNLLDMHNRDIEHLVNELHLENLGGLLKSLDLGKLPLRHDRDVDDLDNHELCTWRCTITGMSKTSPRAAPEESQRSSAQFVLWVHVSAA